MRTLLFLSLGLLVGCNARSMPTTAPASVEALIDAPATQVAQHPELDRLWAAALDAARDRFFVVDRQDRRLGLITTQPLVSSQFFEPWRQDQQDADDTAESSLASVRRSVRFEFFERNGRWTVAPKVVVERLSQSERRVTSTAQYRVLFRRSESRGSVETDAGVDLPRSYWYPLRRDATLEAALAEDIAQRVRS